MSRPTKLVSWALVSWADQQNSFGEHSFREQTKKTRFVSCSRVKTRFVSSAKNSFREHSFREQRKKLVSWALVSWADEKTRFVSNFTSLVSKSAHEFAHEYLGFRFQIFVLTLVFITVIPPSQFQLSTYLFISLHFSQVWCIRKQTISTIKKDLSQDLVAVVCRRPPSA